MEDGIFPGDMAKYNEEDMEEERRLCYVAITRAKKELYLSSSRTRMIFGQPRRNPRRPEQRVHRPSARRLRRRLQQRLCQRRA